MINNQTQSICTISAYEILKLTKKNVTRAEGIYK